MKLIVSDIYQSVKDKAEELQIGTVSAIGVYKEMCVLCVNTAISPYTASYCPELLWLHTNWQCKKTSGIENKQSLQR